MGRKSRQRGKSWELEVCRALEAVGIHAERLLTEAREGEGYDIDTPAPLIIQCKAGKRPRWRAGLKEAIEAADGTGQYPACFTKRQKGRGIPAERTVHIDLDAFLDLISELVEIGHWSGKGAP